MVLVMESGNGAVGVEALPTWADAAAHLPASYDIPTPLDSTPFPRDDALNSRVILWDGDVTDLRADAIVVPMEDMPDCSPFSERLFFRAGPGLKRELTEELSDCRSGDLVVTNGYRLPARYVIHTVGPKYNPKFRTAAENSLHNCYRNILQKCHEMRLNSVGICVINSVKKNFPPDEGAHVCLRTLRRFLERSRRRPQRVVLVVGPGDAALYEVLLPLYFPRSASEERAATIRLPPIDVGPTGEPLHPERRIRIIDNPHHCSEGK